jgi:hypothetical protein
LERTQAMGAVRQQVWSEAQEEVASLRTQLNTQVAAASEAEERHRQALEVNELRAGRTSLPHVVDRFPHITCRRSQITDHRSQITNHAQSVCMQRADHGVAVVWPMAPAGRLHAVRWCKCKQRLIDSSVRLPKRLSSVNPLRQRRKHTQPRCTGRR